MHMHQSWWCISSSNQLDDAAGWLGNKRGICLCIVAYAKEVFFVLPRRFICAALVIIVHAIMNGILSAYQYCFQRGLLVILVWALVVR